MGGSWSSPGSRQRSEEATDAACLKTAGKRSKMAAGGAERRACVGRFIAPHPSRREEASSISDHVEDPALFQNSPPRPLPVINERNRIKAEVKTGEVRPPSRAAFPSVDLRYDLSDVSIITPERRLTTS